MNIRFKFTITLLTLIFFSFVFKKGKIEKIFNSSKFTVKYTSGGCFHMWEEVYHFEKGRSWKVEYKHSYDSVSSQFEITQQEIDKLQKVIEKGIKRRNRGFCTTRELCEVFHGKDTVTYRHDDCAYYDFRNWSDRIIKK